MAAAVPAKLRVALCQMAVGASKEANVAKAVAMVAQAKADHKADVVVLPECFNCPYGTKYFREYAEEVPPVGTNLVTDAGKHKDGTATSLARAAQAAGVTLIGGSIPEIDAASGKVYNTSLSFAPTGLLTGRHRKMHLFQINTDTVKFDEATVLTAGDSPTIVPVGADPQQPTCTAGVGICFDIRYPLLAAHYHQQGTSLLCYPGAFNMVTGPKHWTHCARSRAVDTQQFVALCSPSRDPDFEYVAWGHSLICDPWGEVIVEAAEGETIVAADVDLAAVASTRAQLPITAGVRNDLYAVQWQPSKQ
jgi:predicted amidohydrolase